jgi:hypothetical protein
VEPKRHALQWPGLLSEERPSAVELLLSQFHDLWAKVWVLLPEIRPEIETCCVSVLGLPPCWHA